MRCLITAWLHIEIALHELGFDTVRVKEVPGLTNSVFRIERRRRAPDKVADFLQHGTPQRWIERGVVNVANERRDLFKLAHVRELSALWQESLDAIWSAKTTIETETERSLDLSNSDPDTADDKIRKAQRTVDRLSRAIPQLKDRVEQIDVREYAAQ